MLWDGRSIDLRRFVLHVVLVFYDARNCTRGPTVVAFTPHSLDADFVFKGRAFDALVFFEVQAFLCCVKCNVVAHPYR